MRPTNEAVADALDDAAGALEALGWCQGAFESVTGKRCALGAIEAACKQQGAGYVDAHLQMAAEHQLGTHIGIGHFCIPKWNDQPGRTEQQVLDALRAAAKEARP